MTIYLCDDLLRICKCGTLLGTRTSHPLPAGTFESMMIFRTSPLVGICDPPLEGSSKPLISSVAFEVRLLEPSLCLGRGRIRVRVGWDGQRSNSFWWCFMVNVSVSPEISWQQIMGRKSSDNVYEDGICPFFDEGTSGD